MRNVFLVPNWFLGYDILFELLFILITFFVSLYAFKVYQLSGEEKPKLFAAAFLFISLGYFVQMIMNSIFFFFLKDLIFTPYQAYRILLIYSVSMYAYTFILLTGLVVLVYMTFGIKRKSVFILLLLMSLMILMVSVQKLFSFYVLSSIISLFVVVYFFKNYGRARTINSLLVFVGFSLILMSYLLFIFSTRIHLYYFLGHFAKLIGYILILINLLRITNAEKKFRTHISSKLSGSRINKSKSNKSKRSS